jgi:hypothetical protein
VNRQQELAARRELKRELSSMTEDELLEAQEKAKQEMDAAEEGSGIESAKHWAAHRWINIMCWRSFGKLNVPCRHR